MRLVCRDNLFGHDTVLYYRDVCPVGIFTIHSNTVVVHCIYRMGRSQAVPQRNGKCTGTIYSFYFDYDASIAGHNRNIVETTYETNMNNQQINIKNRRATFDYELLDKYKAGIVLMGTEIKAIRQGKAGLSDTYCYFVNGELWVKNMYIAEYSYGTYNNHSVRRERKLLLTKKELRKIARTDKEAGFSIIPVRLFINEKGLAKLEIAVARGKKMYDKRESIKEREDKRNMERMFKR